MNFLKSYFKSTAVFLLAGFSVLGVYAALSTVSSGDPLTASGWNEIVGKLTSLNTNNDDLVTKSYVDSQISANGGGVSFAGYTTTTYNGNMGGIGGPTKNCQKEFPGSNICTYKDLVVSGVDYPSSGDAWIMDFSTSFASYTCQQWTSSSASSTSRGAVIRDSGITTLLYCNEPLPIACCNG